MLGPMPLEEDIRPISPMRGHDVSADPDGTSLRARRGICRDADAGVEPAVADELLLEARK